MLTKFVACLGLLVVVSAMYQIPQEDATVDLDSGMLVAGSKAIVFSQVVHVPNVDWIRLRFAEVTFGEGAYLRLLALDDGAEAKMSYESVKQWGFTTPYFNGDELLVELIIPTGTKGMSHIKIDSAMVGPSAVKSNNTLGTICGPNDERRRSNEPEDARLVSSSGGVCSTWLFNRGPADNRCFGTAGHCTTSSGTYTAEFNVPDSTSSGTIVHPGPEDQYPSDPRSLQYRNGGIGNDWAYLGFFANTRGEFASSKQKQYTLDASHASRNPGVTICGYGSSSIRPMNLVQKIHEMPSLFSFSGNTLRYKVDTTGGNSGSAVSDGNIVYGVHTHGGCTSSNTGSNAGTWAGRPEWAAALNSPLGVCAGK